jgi:uncharacterized protein UPF0149
VSVTWSSCDPQKGRCFDVKVQGERTQPPATKPVPITFDELDAYLSSDETPEDCIQLSDLDGFLTALLISPLRI